MKLIQRDGWLLNRQKGSHRQFTHAEKHGVVTVPGKPSDDLHPKTLESILRQAGLKDSAKKADDEGAKEGGRE